ncbi:LysR family transcriptional regulator [uncultured Eubacterium sp.]|uniref:LysR family transcriptional regulator n=1 Tax=uncultured Eubacterium sp. TaxID=165185 RepID=UPI0025950B9B|nr:LysR family transcriptional regulator [uncultured Eubacterium sp.]
MTLQQLEYFVSAAHNLNFSKTAELFFISQSAVTQQIRSLEKELKLDLFIRKNNRLSLTDSGQVFLREAEQILAKVSDSIERVHSVQHGRSGTLRIGYIKCMEMGSFPRIIQNFYHKYPGIGIDLKRDNAVALHDDFLMGEYDLIFNVESPILSYPDTAEIRKIGEYPFFAVIPPEHPLTHREVITQQDLKYERLIIHNFNRSKSEFPHDFPTGYLESGLVQNISKTNDDATTIQIMVAAGMGIGILTELEVEKASIPLNLSYIPLETNGIQEILYVIYSKKNENPLIPLFLEEIKK